jgi:hypothetical protein
MRLAYVRRPMNLPYYVLAAIWLPVRGGSDIELAHISRIVIRYVRAARWSGPTDPEASPPGSDRRAWDTHAPARFQSCVARAGQAFVQSPKLTQIEESSTKRDPPQRKVIPTRGISFEKLIGSWNCPEGIDRTNRPRRGVGIAHQLGVNGRFGRRKRRPKI